MPEERRDRNTPTGVPAAERPRTGFDPSDAPRGDREQYQRLAKINRGMGASSRAAQKHEGGIERDLGVIAARLGITDSQKERAQWLLKRCDLKDEVIPAAPVEVAVLAVVSLAIDEDRTRYARHDAGKKQSVLRDTAFAQLLEEFNVSRRQVRRARQRVRETDIYESPNS